MMMANDLGLLNKSQKVQEQSWQALRVYFIYRFALALFLIWAVLGGKGPDKIASYDVDLFASTLLVYAVLLLVSAWPLVHRRWYFTVHAYGHLALDLFCLPLLIHASGGLGSSIEILLLMSVAASGLLVSSLHSVFYAALCSLVLLGEVILTDLRMMTPAAHYSDAAFLGASCFAVALLAVALKKRAERSEQLAEQRGREVQRLEKLNTYIIQNLQSGVVIVDSDQQVQAINQSALRFFGLAEQPTSLADMSVDLQQYYQHWSVAPEKEAFSIKGVDREQIHARIMRLQMDELSYSMIWLEDASLETQRIQQSKLASLGGLAASIAHEIRNPLSVISHASQLLSEAVQANPAQQQPQCLRLSQMIEQHAQRVNKIIDNIQQLSNRQAPEIKVLEIGKWLPNMIDTIHEEFQLPPGSIVFQMHQSIDHQHLRADPSQLRQILTNLCVNAIRYGSATTEQPVIVSLETSADSFLIEVRDQGPGISEAHVGKLFSPFFTTSDTGTGLGLYISRELAELNRATLQYSQAEQGGALFRITFMNRDQQVVSV